MNSPTGRTNRTSAYSKILTEISSRAVSRFNALDPPAAVRKPFAEYVEAQERVKAYDRAGLAKPPKPVNRPPTWPPAKAATTRPKNATNSLAPSA